MQLKGFNDITPDYQHIYLSPHFDDAVYSCGGTVGVQASLGQRPLVITVFAGIPSSELKLSSFALKMHKLMGFGQNAEAAIITRRKEDASALTHLGADYLWLDYLDAIYRGVPAYYTRRRLVSGKYHPGDLWVDWPLTQDLVALHERLPNVTWFTPLAIGRHVDHQIVFSAARHLMRLGAHVKFYEDFPYIVLRARALQKRLKELGNTLKPELAEVSEMLHLRQEAAEMYDSQVKLNFGNKAAMYKAIRDYTLRIYPSKMAHMERYWKVCI